MGWVGHVAGAPTSGPLFNGKTNRGRLRGCGEAVERLW